jgi:D-sedoheptulose 7-phosphate isomerase
MRRLATLLDEHLQVLAGPLARLSEDSDRITRWSRRMAHVLDRGGRVFTAGNGGSAAQAQHLAAELVGRYRDERRPLAATALTTDPSVMTALLNDYGADLVFARQVQGLARVGDVLVLLSTSGRSRNVVAAAEMARTIGVTTWAMTGPAPNSLAAACDDALVVDAPTAAAVQEVHLVALHALCECLDRVLLHEARE